MKSVVAIEIDSPETWETICALQPECKELSLEENLGNFMVVSPGVFESSIFSPGALAAQFDRIEPSDRKIKFVTLVVG